MKAKEKILKAGLKIWPDITGKAIGEKTGISRQAVFKHFPQGTLKNTIAEYAVKTGHSRVILQLIATDHPAIENLAPSERIKHFNAV